MRDLEVIDSDLRLLLAIRIGMSTIILFSGTTAIWLQ
jgi:hypothetical protein